VNYFFSSKAAAASQRAQKKPFTPDDRANGFNCKVKNFLWENFNRPLPFAGIIRIRFQGLDYILSARIAPPAIK
jgi:hypothetical protein